MASSSAPLRSAERGAHRRSPTATRARAGSPGGCCVPRRGKARAGGFGLLRAARAISFAQSFGFVDGRDESASATVFHAFVNIRVGTHTAKTLFCESQTVLFAPNVHVCWFDSSALCDFKKARDAERQSRARACPVDPSRGVVGRPPNAARNGGGCAEGVRHQHRARCGGHRVREDGRRHQPRPTLPERWRAFLDDQTTMVFQATVSGSSLVSSNVVSFDTASSCQVVLTKLKAGALTAADVPANVAVSSMSHSPVSALYTQLKSVYGPMMSDSGGLGVDAKLVGLLAELEAGLGNHLRLTGGLAPQSGAVDPATAPLVGIVTPLDEIKMWSVAFSDAAPRARARRRGGVPRARAPEGAHREPGARGSGSGGRGRRVGPR